MFPKFFLDKESMLQSAVSIYKKKFFSGTRNKCWSADSAPRFLDDIKISSLNVSIRRSFFVICRFSTVLTLNLLPAGPTGPSTNTWSFSIVFLFHKFKTTSMMCQSWAVGSATKRPLWRNKIVVLQSHKGTKLTEGKGFPYLTVPSKPRFWAATAAAAIVFTFGYF